MSKTKFDYIIPPEIKNDEFYTLIQRIAQDENVKTVLEIGSSSGEGSTEAFVTGLRKNSNQPTFFCLEVSKARCNALKNRYKKDTFVKCYNASSVSVDQFPSEQEVKEFYDQFQTGLNNYPLEQVLDWLREDKEYLQAAQVPNKGIQEIKEQNKVNCFDLVLIDGSQFTGSIELEEVYGAKFILLDDILTYKNYHNWQKLIGDVNYTLVACNPQLRHGYTVFKRTDVQPQNYQTIQAAVESIQGFMIPGQEEYLFNKVKSLPDEAIVVEVGSFKGRSTVAMAYACIGTNKRIYCLDTWDGNDSDFLERDFFSDWQTNIKNNKLEQSVLPLKGKSHDILNYWHKLTDKKKIDFVFIDGSHQYLDVLKDFELSYNLVKEKSWIAFHDVIHTHPGSENVWHNIAKHYLSNHEYSSSLACGQKVNGSALAFQLPIHFFTIVLNGEPFIRYYIEVFNQLPFEWHWHIVEGVADLKHDTAWCLQRGGQISDEIHDSGRSNDGTSEYLDELAQQYPDNITVYRKPKGDFWDGKLEMVNAPLANIKEECLLWQVDVDELWTVEQLCTARHMFIGNPEKTAAFYWCWYFVGEELVIRTRNCYAQNPRQEWLRTWRFKPGYIWASHSPPILVKPLPDNKWRNVATTNPFTHAESEERNLVFQHFAYVTPSQLQFKEKYYGYRGALAQWELLQEQTKFPVYLNQYFSWVQDATMVDTVESCGIVPIAQKDKNCNTWKFVQVQQPRQTVKLQIPPKIFIDAVFFQLFQTGIARVWRSLLEEWANTSFCNHIVILDRAGTAPKIPGIRYRTISAYNVNDLEGDRQLLQQVCDQEGADLFISSYYTTPLSTPSVMMVYDMIPETLGWDIEHPNWRGKHHAIEYASSYLAISENTASDLVKFFPDISSELITVAYCGVKSSFTPASAAEINNFKTNYGISKPYFLLVGANGGYKNAFLFFRAFAQLCSRGGFEIVCVGSQSLLKEDFRTYTSGSPVHILQLSDEELKAAYSGAVALVYPSKLEGFGLPILEAIACGCPVITCPNASIPEVAAEAAIYVKDEDVSGMANALCEVQKPEVRNSLIAAGLEQAKQFSWAKMAQTVSSVLIDAPLQTLNLREINLIIFPDWSAPEETLGLELQEVIAAIATHPNKSDITLLVDSTNISAEDAHLFLSGVAMNLLMEDLEVSEDVQISVVGQLDETQWQTLLPRLQARIVLNHENHEAITAVNAESLKADSLESFSNTALFKASNELNSTLNK